LDFWEIRLGGVTKAKAKHCEGAEALREGKNQEREQRAMARAHAVLLVALAASALAFAAAQQPQYYDPQQQQQVQAATTQTQRPSQPETEPNLFENVSAGSIDTRAPPIAPGSTDD